MQSPVCVLPSWNLHSGLKINMQGGDLDQSQGSSYHDYITF